MSATLTKVSGPFYQQGRGTGYTFSIALDNSHAAGGEPIDITSYLGYLYEAQIGGVDAIADAVMKYDCCGPGRAVAVTDANVLITAHHSSGADAAMNPADAEDLSAVGALIVTCWGLKAAVTSWA
jgi:hypothetical protein